MDMFDYDAMVTQIEDQLDREMLDSMPMTATEREFEIEDEDDE